MTLWNSCIISSDVGCSSGAMMKELVLSQRLLGKQHLNTYLVLDGRLTVMHLVALRFCCSDALRSFSKIIIVSKNHEERVDAPSLPKLIPNHEFIFPFSSSDKVIMNS
jgi:hypothetical protein